MATKAKAKKANTKTEASGRTGGAGRKTTAKKGGKSASTTARMAARSTSKTARTAAKSPMGKAAAKVLAGAAAGAVRAIIPQLEDAAGSQEKIAGESSGKGSSRKSRRAD